MNRKFLIGVALAGVLSGTLVTPVFAHQAGSADVDIRGTDIDTDIIAIGDADLTLRAYGHNQRNYVMVGNCHDGSSTEAVIFTRPGLNFDIPRCR